MERSREMPDIGANLDRIERKIFEAQAVEGASALSFLRAVYSNRDIPLPVRMRAAEAALPYESPKLSAVMTASMDEERFAERLEAARQRAGLGFGEPIASLPLPAAAPVNEKATTVESRGPLPEVSDRRYRR